jgi:hypothetical protein
MTHARQLFKLGATAVHTHSDDFADGYGNGFVAHPHNAQEPMTDTMLYDLIATNISDTSASHEWNAGFVLGALEGLRKERPVPTPESKVVQCGTVALRLNHWQFREGFLNGQEDRQADLAQEEAVPTSISARDLLSYIAHRDPATGRYFLGKEELHTFEETLGQVVGYLCTALFSTLQASELARTGLFSGDGTVLNSCSTRSLIDDVTSIHSE